MSIPLLKFPKSPHLLWLGARYGRHDKVMSAIDVQAFLSHEIIVEEKIDGANIGISFDNDGKVHVQNRGHWVDVRSRGQFAPLAAWLRQHEHRLNDTLGHQYTVFGEWCFARHSISYTSLPDWFLAFDILERKSLRFLSTRRRNNIAHEAGIQVVPRVDKGTYRVEDVVGLIGESSLYKGPMEGIYLRSEDAEWLHLRAKVVRSEFSQQISEHWLKGPLVPNGLNRAHSK